MMKKITTLLLAFILFAQLNSNAQMYEKGDVFPEMVLTDIKGKKYDLYDYLDKGYAILIEMATTTCAFCWDLKKLDFLNQIHKEYGPNGTKKKGKILVLFVEADVNSSTDDLYGKGTRTLGDWVTGANYPIVDLKNNDELAPFFKAPSTMKTPAFYLVCSDKKIYDALSGMGEVGKISSGFIRDIDNCAKGGPTNINEATLNNAIKVYPMPATGQVSVSFEDREHQIQDITMVNMEGRSVLSLPEVNAPQTNIDVNGLQSGIYMMSITLENGTKLNKKIVIAE